MAGKGQELKTILMIVGKVDPSVARAAKSAQSQMQGVGNFAGKQMGGLSGGAALATGAIATIGVAAVATVVAAAAVAGKAVFEFGKDSLEASKQFESAFAGVKKTVEATHDMPLDQIRQDLRDMALEIPKTAEEIAGIAEMAGQLGVKAPDIAKFSRTMADLDVATDLGGEEGAKELAQFMNIMGIAPEYVDRAGSSIVDLGNNAATTESQILEMAKRLAGGASVAGISGAETFGFAAGFASLGLNEEAAGTSFTKFQNDLGAAADKGGKALASYAKVAGMTAQEFGKLYKSDAAEATLAVFKGLKKVNDEGGSLNETIESLGVSETRYADLLRRGALGYEVIAPLVERGNVAWEENTALTKEAAERYKTLESQLQLFENQKHDLKIDVGDLINPAAAGALEHVRGWLGYVADKVKDIKAHLRETGLDVKLGEALRDIGERLDAIAVDVIDRLADSVVNFMDYLIENPEVITEFADRLVDMAGAARDLVDALLDIHDFFLDQDAWQRKQTTKKAEAAGMSVDEYKSARSYQGGMRDARDLEKQRANNGGLTVAQIQAGGTPGLSKATQDALNYAKEIDATREKTGALQDKTKEMTGTVSSEMSMVQGYVEAGWSGVAPYICGEIDKVNAKINAMPTIPVPGALGNPGGSGGKSQSTAVPSLKGFAAGGITNGPALAGEAGYPEYVISTDPQYRSRSQALLTQAQEQIGGASSGSSNIQLHYAPVINADGGGDRASIEQVLEEGRVKLMQMLLEVVREGERADYGRILNPSY